MNYFKLITIDSCYTRMSVTDCASSPVCLVSAHQATNYGVTSLGSPESNVKQAEQNISVEIFCTGCGGNTGEVKDNLTQTWFISSNIGDKWYKSNYADSSLKTKDGTKLCLYQWELHWGSESRDLFDLLWCTRSTQPSVSLSLTTNRANIEIIVIFLNLHCQNDMK